MNTTTIIMIAIVLLIVLIAWYVIKRTNKDAVEGGFNQR